MRRREKSGAPGRIARVRKAGPRTIRSAFEAWSKDKAERHLRVFVAALKSPHPDARSAAMYALSAVGTPSHPFLVRALQEDAARASALRLLRNIGDARSRGAVQRLLGHPDYLTRQLAFRTLMKLEGQRAAEEAWSREVMVKGRIASLTTIIHGTWAEDETWWRWPDEFPKYLDSLTGDFYKGMDPFQWPGDNTLEDREKGARGLTDWLKTHPADRVTLIAHSHGGNVVFKATELAEAGEIGIDKLILLGTPIRDDYAPDLGKVGKIVNVYSDDDIIQWFGTWTPDMEYHARDGGQVLPDGEQVTNREVSTRTDNPHSELHTAALWRRERLGTPLKDP